MNPYVTNNPYVRKNPYAANKGEQIMTKDEFWESRGPIVDNLSPSPLPWAELPNPLAKIGGKIRTRKSKKTKRRTRKQKGGLDYNMVLLNASGRSHRASDVNINIMQNAIDNGADVNVLAGPYTPLINASREGRVREVEFLLNNGADPTITNNLNKSPYMVAIDMGHTDVANILDRHPRVQKQKAMELVRHRPVKIPSLYTSAQRQLSTGDSSSIFNHFDFPPPNKLGGKRRTFKRKICKKCNKKCTKKCDCGERLCGCGCKCGKKHNRRMRKTMKRRKLL